MSSSLSWYQRHLGTPAPAPQAPAPTRFVVVDGKAYPAAGEAAPVPQPWSASPAVGDAPVGQVHVLDGVQLWHGTREAQTTKTTTCPHCGSGNYMPHLGGGGRAVGHCFGCGFRADSRGEGAPTLQGRTSGVIRGVGQGPVPVEQARSAGGNTDAAGRVSGRFSALDLAGKA